MLTPVAKEAEKSSSASSFIPGVSLLEGRRSPEAWERNCRMSGVVGGWHSWSQEQKKGIGSGGVGGANTGALAKREGIERLSQGSWARKTLAAGG